MTKNILLLLVAFSVASCKNENHRPLTTQELKLIFYRIEKHNEEAKKVYATAHNATSIIQNPFDLDTAMTIEKWIKWCGDHKFNFIEKLDTLKVK